MYLWPPKKSFEKTAERNCQEREKISTPTAETFLKTEDSCKKVIPKYASLDIKIAILTTPDWTFGRNTSLNGQFFFFSCPKECFFRIVHWDTLWDPALILLYGNTHIYPSSAKINIQKRKISKKIISRKASRGTLEGWFENPVDIWGQKFEINIPFASFTFIKKILRIALLDVWIAVWTNFFDFLRKNLIR